ncbi:hypothetical protein GIB67_040136 [Kingdonia uniflora]|uniref:Protein kinase domain-containing protein n=1 Tax=Kingdonia uniflora TaxID=39325 RepID=A0A7J7MUZ8_9MAGN|nr:hypothetical protein GIB67_040136 [Kingdonia uniflora]
MKSLLLLLLLSLSSVSSLNSDGLSLLSLKSSITTDPTRSLSTWVDSDSTPCSWAGITCSPHNNRVTQIDLPNKGFNGYIPSQLGAISTLKRLSLFHNNFTKPIPSLLFNASNLVFLDLSHNRFTGGIPDQVKTLKKLVRLDLSSNQLNGSLPDCLSELSELTGTLNLSYNGFSGGVPEAYGKFMISVSLDLRYNNLSGKIPQIGSLLNQGPTAFAGNLNLCGFPLQNVCAESENPRVPENVVTPKPEFSKVYPVMQRGKSKGGLVIVPIIAGFFIIIGVASVSVWLFWRKCGSKKGNVGKEKSFKGVEEVSEEGQKGKFVVMVEDEEYEMELEDLLRASAYVMGKSWSGIVYKVVVGRRGAKATVAVRRLSEGGGFLKFKEFESEVEAIGKVRHQNVVRLRAYYYASDEKLLVSDFIPNGSLYNALHGKASNSLPPLSWTTRLKIAQGTARGLVYIHECSPRKYVHGNIRSSKILLGEDLQPYVSGFGLTRLVVSMTNTSKKQSSTQHRSLTSPSTSYLAPEARIHSNRLTQKCDVYSFGILLLEILTGRLPDEKEDEKSLESCVRMTFREERPLCEILDEALLDEVHAKKQVLAVFHIALNCTELDPEMRPRMRAVFDSLDRIGVSH